jgi:hypothetical protein
VRVTVLVVDDHEAFRTSARFPPEAEALEVVGEEAVLVLAVAERLAEFGDPPAVPYGPCVARAPVCGFAPKSELSGAALRRLLP